MTVAEILNMTKLEALTGDAGLQRQVNGGYTSDLLSDVMGRIEKDSIWVTMQSHMNVIGIAALRDLPAVLIVNGNIPSEEVITKAKEENIAILSTKQGAFDASGELYNKLKS